MDLAAILLTVTAGVAMGAINNLAGGAGIFGLMAFEYACGLPLAIANPSLRPAAVCVGVFSFLGYLRAGQKVPLRTWLTGLWAVPGAPLGSWLALHLPDLVFWLYLAVFLGFLLWQQTRPQVAAHQRRKAPPWAAPLSCFLVGVHMGYAQIGVGLVTTMLLAATATSDLVAVSAAKSVLVILTSLTSVASFWSADALAWQPALWLALGTAIGAYEASRFAVRKGEGTVRTVVLAVTALMLVYVLYKVVALTVAPG